MRKTLLTLAGVVAAAGSYAVVLPTAAHAAFNFIPFGAAGTVGIPTMHQVFRGNLFGATPVVISQIAFAPGVNGTFNLGQVTINLGYTNAIPGVASTAGGLVTPTEGGGGNNVGAMSTFYSNASTSFNFAGQSSSNFQMAFVGTPFTFDPGLGNLLVEIVAPSLANTTLTVSRSAGSAEASRAYSGTRFANGESPTTATRMDFTYTAVPEPGTMAAIGLGVAALLRRRRK